MGLFTTKKQDDEHLVQAEVDAAARQALTAQFQEELRQMGRDHFKTILAENTADLRVDIDGAVQQIASDLRDYMQRQLDMTIARVNTEITDQLSDRLKQFDAAAAESREAMVRSLNRDTQELRDKYQQLSASLQQSVAQQEVMMIGAFQDHKTRLSVAQRVQDETLASLTDSAQATKRQSEHLEKDLREVIQQQKTALDAVYQENLTRVEATRTAQEETLSKLTDSATALQDKHQQLAQFLDKTVADQKTMMTEAMNDNMSRIVEHYIIAALGEQSELRTQLPGILQQLEQHKQEMMDDIAL